MLGAAFLVGLFVKILLATLIIRELAKISGKWLKKYVEEKLRNREKHIVAFIRTKDVIMSDEFRREIANSREVSMDELERMDEKSPYIAAVLDENDEIEEYEGFKASEYNENFEARMKQMNGIIVVEG